MASDARYRTKVFLDAKLDNSNLTKDDGETWATFTVCYADAPYPMTRVFSNNEKDNDVVFAVGDPESKPLMNYDGKARGYEESVPILVLTTDKVGVTGNLMKWKAEAELRRVFEEYPYGSRRGFDRRRDATQHLGSTTLYSLEFRFRYERGKTV